VYVKEKYVILQKLILTGVQTFDGLGNNFWAPDIWAAQFCLGNMPWFFG